ncbi:B12-binding domain-containing protein [Methylobacterium sp. J-067]|uniref:cobalamin B12-binding domain-containing protein n=1 Tax=Methylobacterium sp. J-067 TaxID=2836648 RepID=UPI001FBA589B|nr:cobalamin B12-binding domain-containing protein [Methylobacterium sp. J-067]MCJ2024388.1 cobalamin B12-binding domain-containing protein [Methylobacterium sp. J-067]
MRDFGSSGRRWEDAPPRDSHHAAEARQLYARKRAAEAARLRCLALGQVVRAEIIPQLVLRHRDSPAERAEPAGDFAEGEVAAFTDLALAADDEPIVAAFTALMAAGHSTDRLFLDLLAPCAALLGRLWDEDLCDFIEVTTGVARLQRLVARFRLGEGTASPDGRRRLLLLGAPDEQHTLGVRVVEQFLRRAGWDVAIGLSASREEIAARVAAEWFGVVGLTLSSVTRVEPVAAIIRAVREASCNRAVGVMVGGPMFLRHPDLVHRVGADASAVDAATAVLLAQRLLDLAADQAKSSGPNEGPNAFGAGTGGDAGRPRA